MGARRVWWAVLCGWLVWLGAGVATAQPEAEGENAAADGEPASAEAGDGEDEPTPIERARSHMERGQALYLQARFEEAAAEFEAAYEAQPFSAFLYNAGVALERAGQPDRAAEFFEQYMERDPEAADNQRVRERIARLRAGPDAPAGETPSGEQGDQPEGVPEEFKSLLSIRTNPEGATVIVRQGSREVARGPAPFAHTLDQGRYRMVIEHPDYQTVEQDVRIEPGKVYVVIVEMSQGQFLGYMRVVSNVPGAQVYIDDREQGSRGQTPFEAPMPIGTHTIWVERPGYQVEETEAEVGIGEDVMVRVDLTRVDFGRLRVVANVAGARVLIDGNQVGEVPYEGQVPGGEHHLTIAADGMKNFEQDITIRRGQLTPVRVTLRPAVGSGAAYVTTVFSALFLGGAIAVAVLGNDYLAALQLEQENGRLAADDPRLDEGLFFYIGADAGFTLSLVLGSLAIYYFLYDDLPPSEGRVLEARDWAFSPFVDPECGTAGVGILGSF